MNLEAAILYGIQRMTEFGKKKGEYHYEPVFVCPTKQENIAGSFTVAAYNEIYIPVHSEKFFGLFILADDSGYTSENPLGCGAPEFTGLIYFNKIGLNWSFEIAGGGAAQGGIGQGGEEIETTIVSAEFLRVVY